mgnify:CR=1 FL=1
MKITGYKLQHAIREAMALRDLAASQWDGVLYAFEDEHKPTPAGVMGLYLFHEHRLCALQVGLARYNLAVTVQVQGAPMTLCEAVKRVGGAGRAEKMWRMAATGGKKDRYERELDRKRSTGETHAQRTTPTDEAVKRATGAGRFAAALREAIQVGNATEVEIGINPAAFEATCEIEGKE